MLIAKNPDRRLLRSSGSELTTLWLPFSDTDTYGTTAGYNLLTENNATRPSPATLSRPNRWGTTTPRWAGSPPTRRRASRRATIACKLTDDSISHGLEALGFVCGHWPSVEAAVESLEDDTYSSDLRA